MSPGKLLNYSSPEQPLNVFQSATWSITDSVMQLSSAINTCTAGLAQYSIPTRQQGSVEKSHPPAVLNIALTINYHLLSHSYRYPILWKLININSLMIPNVQRIRLRVYLVQCTGKEMWMASWGGGVLLWRGQLVSLSLVIKSTDKDVMAVLSLEHRFRQKNLDFRVSGLGAELSSPP